MSDVSQGPGWWLASDGRWYSPEQAPGIPAVPTSEGPPTAPPFGPSTGPPTAPPFGPGPSAPPYGVPPAGSPYGYPPAGPAYGYGAAPPPTNNGLAIASMVCSFFFWIYGVPAVLAVVFGFIARSQIRRSNGMQKGGSMALAGIIIGFIGIAIGIALVIVVVTVVHRCGHNGTICINDNN